MIQDLRYAFRSLAKSPGFTVAAVATLALGIGANSAIFSVVDAVLLKPLAYRDPQQLMLVFSTAPGGIRHFVSQPDLEDLRASSRSFRALAGLVQQSVNLTGQEAPERIVGSFVSSNYFDVLEVSPAVGRVFIDGEDKAGAPLTAVLTDRVWHSHFGGDPNVLGRKALFNGEPYTVIGILRSDFVDQPSDADVYLPAFKYPDYAVDRGRENAAVLGRLRPGVSMERAQSETATIAARLAAAYPETNRERGVLLVPLKEIVIEDLKPSVLGLTAAVGFILLIACTNVAALFAARILARSRERAVRLALGASRAQLISHVLAEAVVLSIAGATIGIGLAWWGIEAISKAMADQLPAGVHLLLNPNVVWFTAGLAAISALLIAAIPACRSSEVSTLRESRGAASGWMRNRTRGVLVAAEIAMAVVLLAGAGLTLKSLQELGRAQLGFDPRNLMTFEYRVPFAKYPSAGAQVEFHRQVIEQILKVPGVIAASSVRAAPLGGNGETDEFLLTDRPEPATAADRPRGLFNAADANFFATLRIPVLRGRVFNQHDSEDGAKVIVINQTLATRYFGDRDPLGSHLRIPAQRFTAQIIGVVGDVKQFRPEDQPAPQIYGALAQNPFIFTSVAVRTAQSPALAMDDIRHALWRVDRDQPMWKMRTVSARLATLAAPREFVSWLLGGYAALALLLTAIGIFGVISYSVNQRTAEIGIRMALGARPRDVARMILRQGARITGIGIAAGIGAAAWLTPLMRAQLYAVSPLDPSVYAVVAALLIAVAIAACLIPARRAMRVDPLIALRHD